MFGIWNPFGRGTGAKKPFPKARIGNSPCTGYNYDDYGTYVGQAIPPLIPQLEMPNATAISAGGRHSLVLLNDGTVVAWGSNTAGESTVPNDLSNVVAIAAGYIHSVALKNDGTVRAWGDNSTGEISVPPGLTNVIAIAAGGCDCSPNGDQSLALKSDGTVVGWGAYPVPVGLSNIVAISAGANHYLALQGDGTIIGWGFNANGQASPPAGLSNVVAIAAGNDFSLALTRDGVVVAWGNNACGQASVPDGLSNVVAIAAGDCFSLALLQNNSIVGWGDDSVGETSIPSGITNVVAMSAGDMHTLALLNGSLPFIIQPPLDQIVYSGQTATFAASIIGFSPLIPQWQFNGTNLARATNPFLTLTNVQPEDAGTYTLTVTNMSGTSASTNATLTVLTSLPIIVTQPTNLICTFGATATFAPVFSGSLPGAFQWQFNGTNIDGATNAFLVLTNLQFSDAGNYAVTITNEFGTVTSSNATLDVALVTVWGHQPSACPVLTNAIAIAHGEDSFHDLAIKSDGSVAAWGGDAEGQTDIPAAATNVIMVAVGSLHSLALKADGTVMAWGAGSVTNIGPWPNCGQSRVPPGLSNVIAIAAGECHSLALRSNGTVIGWGATQAAYNHGQTNIPPGLTNVISISAGGYYSLALKSDGTVVAWGDNTSGQTKVPVGLSNVVAIAGGYSHTLALKDDGTVVAWGWNGYGQATVPSGLSNVVAIAAGYVQSIALQQNGKVLCWGNDGQGQIDVPSGLTDVVDIAAGNSHSLALIVPSPYFLRQPRNQTEVKGSTVAFKAAVMGVQPLNYQWRFNGLIITNGTSSSLVLNSVQAKNAGIYDVYITNAYGAATSSTASLTVVSRPSITNQPQSQGVALGSIFALCVGVDGTPPLTYQWRFNGTNMPGATNSSFTSVATTTNAGNYLVVITNLYGSATSAAAKVTAFLPPQSFSASVSSTGIMLQLIGTPAYPYVLETATNLLPPVEWSSVVTNTADGTGNWRFVDTNTAAPVRFYRATLP